MKTDGQKNLLIEELKKMPIIQVACSRSGISRATYYRLIKEDAEFAQAAKEALIEGSAMINDLAKSKLISAIGDGKLPAITFWLSRRDPDFAPEARFVQEEKQESLNEEQLELVRHAENYTPHDPTLPSPQQQQIEKNIEEEYESPFLKRARETRKKST